jgi:hypothetical protein
MTKSFAILSLLLCSGCMREMHADVQPQASVTASPEPIHATYAGNLGDRNSQASQATLGAVSTGTLEGDPFRETDASVRGALLYASRVYKAPRALNTITVRRIGGAGAVTHYAIANLGNQFVFGPQFSPDGRFILFKAGYIGDPYDLFYLYVLDTQSKRTKLVAKRALTYHRVLWSPDGRFIAYTEGGDWLGSADSHTNPLRLYVCEWRTGRERFVVQNPSVQESFAWAAPHTLFYSEQHKTAPSSYVLRSDTYRFDTDKGTSRLVIRDAWRPHPSPDGRWLAFLGSASRKPFDVSHWWNDEVHPALCISRSDGNARRVLNRKQAAISALVWHPGSKNLLSLDETKPWPTNTFAVNLWSIESRRRKRLGTLSVRDFKEIPRSALDAPTAPLGFSHDGRALFVATYALVGQSKDEVRYITDEAVVSINLSSGQTSRVARLRDSTEVDWRPLK